MDFFFQRTLDDLIKGLRLNPLGESFFLSNSVEEIRHEIKSTDNHTKAVALQKLTYLHSLHGVDMSCWASFHVVEVMSYPRFAHKKIGYLAASLSFHEGTDVILLVTNQIRKDLSSTNPFEVSLALEFLSVASNDDLARDLTPDLFILLSSSRTLVRKKAIAVMLRIFTKYPDSVRLCFKRLVEALEGSDSSAVSAAIGVFCELSQKDPNLYSALAREFYRILCDSKNNWVLIKAVKIFSKLCLLEPKISHIVVEPICDQLRKTPAKSLMFECIRTVILSLSDHESALKLAISKVQELLVLDDPNLRYLGLHALSLLRPCHLFGVLENKEAVIKSLSDTDPNIKLESLGLVMKMVSQNNIVEISKVLINYALKSDPEFCNLIIGSILSTCSQNIYDMIVDFDWYVSLLAEISRIPHCEKGDLIETQIIDIGMRVSDVRPELVRAARDFIIDPALLGIPFLHPILSAFAWVSGEYVEFSKKPSELLEALLQPRTSLLPPLIRAIYIQSAFKVFIHCLHSYFSVREIRVPTSLPPEGLISELIPKSSSDSMHEEEFNPRTHFNGDPSVVREYFSHEYIVNMVEITESALGRLLGSDEVELVDRAENVLGLIGFIKDELLSFGLQKEEDFEKEEPKCLKVIKLIYSCFTEELGPISISSQERVPIPDGLLLNESLCNLGSFSDIPLQTSISFCPGERMGVSRENSGEPITESASLLAQHRKRHELYYLPLENTEVALNDDYPHANDPNLQENLSDDLQNLVKLADSKEKLKGKPRPVVVRLDEGDGAVVDSEISNSIDYNLLGAVREVLTGDKSVASGHFMNISSSKRKGKDKLNIRKHKKVGKNGEGLEEHRRGHRRHKTKEIKEGSEAAIPDFLL